MNLDKVEIVLRARNGWEAIDLGVKLAKKHYAALLISWCVLSLPFLLVSLILVPYFPTVALLFLWWMKPLYERPQLFLLSRNLFSEKTDAKQAIKYLPQYATTDLLQWLTLRRLSFYRSFDMPVTLLERLSGQARQKRLLQLHHFNGGAAFWLTMICLHIEGLLQFSILTMVIWLMPAEIYIDWWQAIVGESLAYSYVSLLLFYLMAMLVAPFYVACGFSLYINRRIALEGWDIEIGFQRLRSRIKKLQAVNVLFLLVTVIWLVPSPSVAQDYDQPEIYIEPNGGKTNTQLDFNDIDETLNPVELNITSESATWVADDHDEKRRMQVLAEEVLRGTDFHQIEEHMTLNFEFDEDQPQQDVDAPEWLKQVVQFLASSIKWIIILLAIVMVALFVKRNWRAIAGFFETEQRLQNDRPVQLFGMEITPESLPDDVVGECQALWMQGDYRGALALLYRATLSELLHTRNVPFKESHTEGECLALVAKQAAQHEVEFFRQLTNLWQAIAYGHKIPLQEQFNTLCYQWQQSFRVANDQP